MLFSGIVSDDWDFTVIAQLLTSVRTKFLWFHQKKEECSILEKPKLGEVIEYKVDKKSGTGGRQPLRHNDNIHQFLKQGEKAIDEKLMFVSKILSELGYIPKNNMSKFYFYFFFFYRRVRSCSTLEFFLY